MSLLSRVGLLSWDHPSPPKKESWSHLTSFCISTTLLLRISLFFSWGKKEVKDTNLTLLSNPLPHWATEIPSRDEGPTQGIWEQSPALTPMPSTSCPKHFVRQLWFPQAQQWPAMMVPWERESGGLQQNASHCPFLDTSLPAWPSLIPGPAGLPPSQLCGGPAPPSLWLVWPTAWYLFPDWNIVTQGWLSPKEAARAPAWEATPRSQGAKVITQCGGNKIMT